MQRFVPLGSTCGVWRWRPVRLAACAVVAMAAASLLCAATLDVTVAHGRALRTSAALRHVADAAGSGWNALVQAQQPEVEEPLCALPAGAQHAASAVAEGTVVPDVSAEHAPARLEYPSALRVGESAWPWLVPTGICEGDTWVTDERGQALHPLPAAGLSTRELAAESALVMLRCADSPHQDNFALGIMNMPLPVRPQPAGPPLASRRAPHIILIGQDSVSRGAFLRHSPSMQQFMRDPAGYAEHELLDFQFFHSIQHNTNGNTKAMFGNITHNNDPVAGHQLGFDVDNDGLVDTFVAGNDRQSFAQHEGWLWRQAMRRGYSPWWFDAGRRRHRAWNGYNGPFYANGRQYDRKHLDLVHPFWADNVHKGLSRCACMAAGRPCPAKTCVLNRHRLDTMWDRLLDAWRRHAHVRPVFASTWADFAHDAGQAGNIRAQDALDARMFRALFATPEVNHAIVVYYSDHGVNYGIPQSADGITMNLESKRPMLFMWVPKWWLRAHPRAHAALLANRKALVTPYDMYRTLLEIMDGPGSWEERRSPWQLSLFQPVPLNRTCDEAHVPPTYCTCAKWTDTTLREDQLRALERELNHDLPPECMKPLRVAEVESCRAGALSRVAMSLVDKRRQAGLTVTKVTFRLSEQGQRPAAPLMLATLLDSEPGGAPAVTDLRQLDSYEEFVGCLPEEAREGTLAERCVCPAMPEPNYTVQ